MFSKCGNGSVTFSCVVSRAEIPFGFLRVSGGEVNLVEKIYGSKYLVLFIFRIYQPKYCHHNFWSIIFFLNGNLMLSMFLLGTCRYSSNETFEANVSFC